MSPTDLTPDLLQKLRDDWRAATGRVDQLAERVSDLIEWVDDLRAQLARRIDGLEQSTTGAVGTLATTVSGFAETLAAQADLPERVRACEDGLAHLRAKIHTK